MADSRAIGVFDSGLGGLTVAKEIMKLMPFENIVYFGDTARVPYGTKSVDSIIKYARQDERFLLSKGVKMVVAACGTVSSVAANTGNELPVPFVEVISHSVKAAVKSSQNKKIGVLATPATIKSHTHRDLIIKSCENAQIFETAAPLLVSLAEEGWYQKENAIARLTVQEYTKDMKENGVDTLILGCTHFPVFKDLISEYMPDTTLIDMGVSTAEYIKSTLAQSNLENKQNKPAKHLFFVSDKAVTFEKTVKIFLGEYAEKITTDRVDIEKV